MTYHILFIAKKPKQSHARGRQAGRNVRFVSGEAAVCISKYEACKLCSYQKLNYLHNIHQLLASRFWIK